MRNVPIASITGDSPLAPIRTDGLINAFAVGLETEFSVPVPVDLLDPANTCRDVKNIISKLLP